MTFLHYGKIRFAAAARHRLKQCLGPGIVTQHEFQAATCEIGADKSNSDAKGLIFCSTKKLCNMLAEQLDRQGIPCRAIHGDKDQRAREEALNAGFERLWADLGMED